MNFTSCNNTAYEIFSEIIQKPIEDVYEQHMDERLHDRTFFWNSEHGKALLLECGWSNDENIYDPYNGHLFVYQCINGKDWITHSCNMTDPTTNQFVGFHPKSHLVTSPCLRLLNNSPHIPIQTHHVCEIKRVISGIWKLEGLPSFDSHRLFEIVTLHRCL